MICSIGSFVNERGKVPDKRQLNKSILFVHWEEGDKVKRRRKRVYKLADDDYNCSIEEEKKKKQANLYNSSYMTCRSTHLEIFVARKIRQLSFQLIAVELKIL